ncbi:MAG: helix-turn-helix domain-containing protein [Gammaproteobacteria bacterium]|nr:helix-turn-helix domain-containing protein [Gammaproteobacteria bacterium]
MRIAILLMNRCIGSGIHSIVDSLIATNYTLIKSDLKPLFEWDTVSIDGKAIMPTNGLTIHPDYSLAEYMALNTSADAWVFPSVFHSSTGYEKVETAMSEAAPIIPVIQQHYDCGGLLISICSGSFLLAKAGLMNNLPALMHWKSEHHFRRMFPGLKIDTHNAIADYGNIISVIGGGMAYEHLVMHLVERFAGHRTAVDTAKLLMMHLNAPSPQSFRTNVETTDHADELVLRAQRHIEKHSHEDINFSQLSSRLSISDRQLNRRFSKSLQCTPLQYLQTIRINRACNLLELTQLPSSKIVYQIGYKDESSFRRLFKKQMKMTMEAHRRQFGTLVSDITP